MASMATTMSNTGLTRLHGGNYAKLTGKRGVEEKEEKKASAREESRLWEEWLESDSEEEDDERPVPWDVPVNVELTNRQFMERSVENHKEEFEST